MSFLVHQTYDYKDWMFFILIWGEMKYEVIGYNVIDHKNVSTYSNANFELLFFFYFSL